MNSKTNFRSNSDARSCEATEGSNDHLAAAVAEYGAFRDRALAWRWVIAVSVDLCAFLLVYRHAYEEWERTCGIPLALYFWRDQR